MDKMLVVLAAVCLSGCQSTAESEARAAAADDARCRSFGARSGSDAYVNCRTGLHQSREMSETVASAEAAAEGRALMRRGREMMEPGFRF